MRYAARLGGSIAIALLCAGTTTSLAQTTNDGEGYADRLRELLTNQGYSQIEFLDLKGNTFSANACNEEKTYLLTFNRNGRILQKSKKGDCTEPTSDQQVGDDVIIDSLYGRGYLRVDIVDRTPPTLLVNACRGERKFQIRMDNEGDIIDSKEDGECNLADANLEPKQIERILFLQGYRNIRMASTDEAPYTATACNGIREFELKVSAAAQVNMRKATGFCNPGDKNVEYVPPRPVEQGRLSGTDALQPEGCQMVLDWLQYDKPLTFAKESSELSDDDMTLISKMVEAIKRCPSTQILIEGHTSKSGDDNFNQELSEKRALAVEAALRDAGIGDDRLKARGFGEAHPRVLNDADATLNRRIEIQLEWNLSQT